MVCIVDDDLSVRRALGRLVQSFGFDVQLLGSGRECVDAPFIDRAACLVVDIFMPGLSGFELSALLRAAGRNIPTVYISAHHDSVNVQKAEDAGGIAFLHKPCESDLLREAIDKAVASYESLWR